MIGSTIGNYRVLETLGQGGMGIVYKAEDAKLRRAVALKFLTPSAVEDEENHRRFLQEAQAAAALDHPNICGVYQVDECEGKWFIAMPLIEGQSLDGRIAAGPLKLQDAIEITRQMAEGLEEAHAKGIVHRDIKPANAIVSERSRGRLHVTVMDFGLARLAQATRLTRDGRQLGTAAYMSPEQVQGAAVDLRSDIWSLGVVLYEMTVGQLPFLGHYEQALFYSILNEPPEPLTALRSGVPMELERIVLKCLAKETNERYQTCGDLLVDLEALARTLSGTRAQPSSSSAIRPPSAVDTTLPPEPVERPPVGFSVAQLAAAAVGAAALAGLVVWAMAGGGAEPTTSLSYKLKRVTWDGGLSVYPTLSPDGRLLAYSSDRAGNGDLDILVQQVEGGGLIRITDDPADERQVVFSPDGTQLAFARAEAGVFTVPAIGGAPYFAAADAVAPQFSPDGTQLAYVKPGIDGGIFFAPISMGKAVQVFSGFRRLETPLWAPDGKSIMAWGEAATGEIDWWTAPTDGGQPVAIGAAATFQQAGMELPSEEWSRSGSTILVKSGDAELDRVEVAEDGSSISSPVRLTTGAGLEVMPTMAASGLIAFANVRQRRDIWALPLAARAPAEALERITSTEASDTASDISANGQRLVYISNRWGQRDIWTKDLATGDEANVSRDSAEQRAPLLSPSGDEIAYVVEQQGKQTIYIRTFTGGSGRTVCDDCGAPRAWTPDGGYIVYSREPGVHLLELASGQTSLVTGTSDSAASDGALSADGKWLAFHSQGSAPGLYVAPFDTGAAAEPESWQLVLADAEAYSPAWSADGRSLYFTSSSAGSRDLWRIALNSDRTVAGEPQVVRRFPTLRHSLDQMSVNDRQLSIGGGKLFFPMSELSGDIWLMAPR
ncbi:MAG: protein kinase [Acidobacteria bacterium]|nr:protein kinase [Acidobacteriota bacterium]